MSQIATFFIVSLIAIFIENAVFTRALGTCRLIELCKKPKMMGKFVLVLTITTTVSSILSYFVGILIEGFAYKNLFEPLIHIAILSAIYLIIDLVLIKLLPTVHEEIHKVVPLAVFNCATLGALLLPAHKSITNTVSFASSVGFGFGSAIGFALALAFVYEGRKTLSERHIPKDMRGLPITLIYIGLLSLAFYGLIGHQLPF